MCFVTFVGTCAPVCTSMIDCAHVCFSAKLRSDRACVFLCESTFSDAEYACMHACLKVIKEEVPMMRLISCKAHHVQFQAHHARRDRRNRNVESLSNKKQYLCIYILQIHPKFIHASAIGIRYIYVYHTHSISLYTPMTDNN